MGDRRDRDQSGDSGYASGGNDYKSENPENDASNQPKCVTQNTEQVLKEISDILENKNATSHELFMLLDQYKGVVTNPCHILSGGLNPLQMIVDRSRGSLLPAVVQVGWWGILSDKKAGSESVHKGKIARQIAEGNPGRKLLDDFNINQDWDASLTPLMKACRSRDISKANQITEREGQHVYLHDHHANGSLYWAIISGDLDLFERLVDCGQNVLMKNTKGETLLHVASQTGRRQFIEPLIKKHNLNVSVMDLGKKTALDRASELGNIDVLAEFVKCGIQPEATCLVLSGFSGRQAFVRYCLEDLHMDRESVDIYSRTVLHRACEGGHVNIVRYLLMIGSSVTSCTTMRRNLLHIAAESNNMEMFNLIIEKLKDAGLLCEMLNQQDRYNGVDLTFLVRGRDRGRDAFHYVEVERYKVSIFLKKTKSGHVDISEFGNVVNSGWGVNPSQEVIDDIEELFKMRRLNTLAVLDMTPLHVALAKGNSAIAKRLVELGADVNIRDKFGLTPILLAASKGCLDSVCMLERAGADTKAKCNAGHDMKALAELNEHKDIANFAAAEEAFIVAKEFIAGPLYEFSQILEQLNRTKQRKNNKEKAIGEKVHQLSLAVDKALLGMGSCPVQQASDI